VPRLGNGGKVTVKTAPIQTDPLPGVVFALIWHRALSGRKVAPLGIERRGSAVASE
jgi:hypothetical protein